LGETAEETLNYAYRPPYRFDIITGPLHPSSFRAPSVALPRDNLEYQAGLGIAQLLRLPEGRPAGWIACSVTT